MSRNFQAQTILARQFPYIGLIPAGLNRDVPRRTITATINWVNFAPCAAIDLRYGVNPTLDHVASVYIDNLGNPNPVYLLFPDTMQCVTCPAFGTEAAPIFSNVLNCFLILPTSGGPNTVSTRVIFSDDPNFSNNVELELIGAFGQSGTTQATTLFTLVGGGSSQQLLPLASGTYYTVSEFEVDLTGAYVLGTAVLWQFYLQQGATQIQNFRTLIGSNMIDKKIWSMQQPVTFSSDLTVGTIGNLSGGTLTINMGYTTSQ